jgi:hypothetical protein
LSSNVKFPSKVPGRTFATRLEDQLEQLKTDELMVRYAASRRRLSTDRYRPAYPFVRREPNVLASRNGHGLFPEIIAAIEEGRIDTRPWITARMQLAQVPALFGRATKDPGLVKSIVETSNAGL